MSMFKELVVGPQEVEAAAELTAKVGTHNKAHRLLVRHEQNFPAALRTALATPQDKERSDHLDLEEVEEALRDVRGRKAFFESDDELVDAAVHGHSNARTDEDRIVVVLYRKPSGRTAKGVIPYGSVPGSVQAFEDAELEEEGGSTTVLSDEESAEIVRAAEAAREEAVEEVERLRAELEEAQGLQEPFEGYEEENAPELVKRVKEGGREEFGRRGLEQIAEYEESREQPRKTVLEAVKDALSAQG